MGSPTLALLLGAPAIAGAALVGTMPAARHIVSQPVCQRWDAPQMAAAKEVFGQYFEASPPVQKSLQTLPPPVAVTQSAARAGAQT